MGNVESERPITITIVDSDAIRRLRGLTIAQAERATAAAGLPIDADERMTTYVVALAILAYEVKK